MKTPKLLLRGEMTMFIITEHKGRKGNHGPGCLGTISSSLPEIPASFLPLPWDPHTQKRGVHSLRNLGSTLHLAQRGREQEVIIPAVPAPANLHTKEMW